MNSLKGMKKNTLTISYTLAALFMMTACNQASQSGGGVVYNQSCWSDINYELSQRDQPIYSNYWEGEGIEERVYDFSNGERLKAVYHKIDDSCEITLIMW